MIQLPSKIRTTLFNVSVENEPMELFSHDDSRLLVLIYGMTATNVSVGFGRTSQAVKDGDYLGFGYYNPIYFYGPEPLWIGIPHSVSPNNNGVLLVHGIYRA